MKQRVLRLAIPAALKHFLDIVQILIDMLMVGILGVSSAILATMLVVCVSIVLFSCF